MLLGIDTGGTFTDFYLIADDGSISVYKRPSTPDDPAHAVLDGLAEMSIAADEVVHGSTVATNAIIERKGARTALITTRGFRDVLLIGRQDRPKLYDLSPRREPPLVPDELRLEANERLDHRGTVLQPLNGGEVEELLDRVQQAGAQSLAVCFLFSFLNPDHEQVVARAAERRGIAVSASHEVLPEHREYERTSTTVANAYVAPVMSAYLSRLEGELRARGVKRLRVMSSNCGSMSTQSAGRLPVRTAVSGPAGGVAGAFALAQAAGFERIITLDMGGTSTDVALCPGRILERDETSVGGLPVRGPTVDVLSVGAGGGSIARIDEGGALRVGPESAGADPGPACYGRGELPTVTDAQVALGRITPEHFLGGRMSIDSGLALKAMEHIGREFAQAKSQTPGTGDPRTAAAAVLRVANANMERALRVVSVERGHDPRDFTLVAFGGAGPLHACDLAAALRIPRVLVPPYPGVLSALGMATAPVVKELAAAVMLRIAPEKGAPTEQRRLELTRAELAERGRAELEMERFALDGLRLETVLEMRYAGQSYELSVPVEDLDPACFLPLFHEAHRQHYGHDNPSRAVEVVTLRVKLVLPAMAAAGLGGRRKRSPPRFDSGQALRSDSGQASTMSRTGRMAARTDAHLEVWFDRGDGWGPVRTPFYERASLEPGRGLAGPAVVTQMDSTTVVPPAWRADVDERGNLIIVET